MAKIPYYRCPTCRREFFNRVWPIRCCATAAPKYAATEAARLITVEDLSRLTLSLVPRLPKLRRVIGIARSGMLPASILATFLGAELWSIDQHDGRLQHLGTGVRMSDLTLENGADLLIDDSCWSGKAMHSAAGYLVSQGITPLRAAVIVQPDTPAGTVDYHAASIAPHVFEWNITHAPWVQSAAWDIDGVLCRDFSIEEDDDAERYIAAMMAMQPTAYQSRRALHFVTARLERYRPQTEAWLARIGQPIASLTMGPWQDKASRERADVARWKAVQCREIGAKLLVDSSDSIARRVNELLGIMTVSTDSGRVYTARPWSPDTLPPERPCLHRGRQIATEVCSGCWSRGVQVETPIYECAIHGKCHTIRVESRRSIVGEACWLCEECEEPGDAHKPS